MSRSARPLSARALAAALAFAAVLAGPSIAAASVFWLAHDRAPVSYFGH
jgi:ABC-type uncharacterized transport system auxiliary subunit